jgi:acetyl esterase/lipase
MGAAPFLRFGPVRSVLGDRGSAGDGPRPRVAGAGSNAASGRLRVYLDVLYAVHGEPLQGDLYLPGVGQSFPAALLLHGGGFDSGDKSSMTPYATAIAKLGFVVFNANYRYAPPNPDEAPMQDALTALRWLRDLPFVAGDRVGVLGASAGATMALTMGTYGIVGAVVSWSGACEELAPAVTSGSSPCYLAHSNDDPIVPVQDAVDMSAALDAAGVDYLFDRLPGKAHGIALGKKPSVDHHTSTWLRTQLAGME